MGILKQFLYIEWLQKINDVLSNDENGNKKL